MIFDLWAGASVYPGKYVFLFCFVDNVMNVEFRNKFYAFKMIIVLQLYFSFWLLLLFFSSENNLKIYSPVWLGWFTGRLHFTLVVFYFFISLRYLVLFRMLCLIAIVSILDGGQMSAIGVCNSMIHFVCFVCCTGWMLLNICGCVEW